MKGVFRFWGYGPETWNVCIGPEKRIAMEEGQGAILTAFGRIRFSEPVLDLLNEFRDELGHDIPAYIRYRPGSTPKGKVVAILEPEGLPLVSIDNSGCWWFHFDISETIEFVQQEKYYTSKPPIYLRLGISPENMPAVLRKSGMLIFNLSRLILKRAGYGAVFPNLAKDFSVDVWRFLVRALVGDTPAIPLWPDGKRYAVVLNHDVDSEWGILNEQGIPAFRAIEEALGYRSAWMVVTRLHEKGRRCFHDLVAAGHEIGCHGTVHDHQISYLPIEKARQRLVQAQPFFEEFDCVGFRSPGYRRSETLYQALDGILSYDMSKHDCFENATSPMPSREGCGTCFPFRISGADVIEIPTTVTEDFVLEMEGVAAPEAAERQLEIVAQIRRRHGVANVHTHPEPKMSARTPWRECYKTLLEGIANDSEAWAVLPREISAWWREREEKIEDLWKMESR